MTRAQDKRKLIHHKEAFCIIMITITMDLTHSWLLAISHSVSLETDSGFERISV